MKWSISLHPHSCICPRLLWRHPIFQMYWALTTIPGALLPKDLSSDLDSNVGTSSKPRNLRDSMKASNQLIPNRPCVGMMTGKNVHCFSFCTSFHAHQCSFSVTTFYSEMDWAIHIRDSQATKDTSKCKTSETPKVSIGFTERCYLQQANHNWS